MDSSWDNGGYAPPVKSGLPTWAKVLLGCGVVLLLATATCVGGGIFFVSRLSHRLEKQEWVQLRTLTDDLRTEDGAKAVYAQNPGLASEYPTESAFLKAAGTWRERLEPLPATMPSVLTGRISYQVRIEDGRGGHRKVVELRYRNDRGAWITARWEKGRLMALRVD